MIFAASERDGLGILEWSGKSQGQQPTPGLALQGFFGSLWQAPSGSGLHKADDFLGGNPPSEFCCQPRALFGKNNHPFALSDGKFLILAMKVEESNFTSPDVDGAGYLFDGSQLRT